MHSIRPQLALSTYDRIRRLLHGLVAVGLLLNMVAPAMVSAAAAPAPQKAMAPMAVPAGGVKSVSQPVLGNGRFPAFLIDLSETDKAGAKSASSSKLGDIPLASWLSVTSGTRVTPSPELGDSLLPPWLADGGQPTSEKDDPVVVGTGLLPAWFAAVENTPDTAGKLNPWGPIRLLAAGSCTPASDLDLQLTVPPYDVSRGNVNGDVYTVTVTNNGTVTTTEVSLLIDPNLGFYYLGNSASVTSSTDGTINYNDTGTGSPGATSIITLTTPNSTLSPGETITFTFKLATNADAKSGQSLSVTLQSGDSSTVQCKTTQQNVPTVRGNLVIAKSPAAQDGGFGDVVTWTVTLRNTGLGNVYSAVFTDTAGMGLSGLSITPTPTPITLTPEASQVYTVTATVASCNNLTNTVEASWSIGNADGTGTAANPVHDEVDIVFLLEDPNVSVEVGPLPDVNYCGAMDATVPVTVTNTGGAARNLRLSLSSQNVNVTNLDPTNWTQVGNLFTYKGGTPVTDTIRGGETVTLSVRVTSTNVCDGGTASVSFTPIYDDACLLILDVSGTEGSSSVDVGQDAPTLSLTKSGPDPNVVAAGDSFVYTVTVSGQYFITNTNGIVVTDIVPSELENTINSVTATVGTTATTGVTVTWSFTRATSGSYSESLYISVTVPGVGGGYCGAGGSLTNRADAVADVTCPQCPKSDSDSVQTYIQDFLGADNIFTKTASPTELCGPGNAQLITAVLSIRNGITWTNTVYTDTLGQGQFALPLNVVSATTQVTIDGIDRTSDVTITLGPPLTIDFSNVGTYSNTTDITITYQVTASVDSIVGDAASQTEFVFSEFTLGGNPGTACGGSSTGYVGTNITLRRGNLTAAVTPATLSSCQANAITITVSGGSPNTVTDNVVVTFTADISDTFTPISPTYGGAFAGEPVTVTQVGNVVTFTFAITLDLDAEGTISFPLTRPCGVNTPLRAGVSYQDRCDVSRSDDATGGTSTTNSNVLLFATPDRYTVNERTARWRFYMQNGGNQTASDITITNTLPSGYSFYTYTVSSATAPQSTLDSITYVTGTVGGREVVTFTIPSSPGLDPGHRVRFDVTATVAGCDPQTQVDIALFQECGQVDDTCGGRREYAVEFVKGLTSLLSSNNQTANLPLCEEGWIELIVKNTSAASDEFDFTITDILTNATFVTQTARVTVTNQASQVVTGTTSGVLLQNIPFTPTVTTVGNTDTVTWTVASFASGTPQYDVLAERDASDIIKITFRVGTACVGTAAEVQSSGAAKDVCDVTFSFAEDSASLITDAPELTIAKSGRNATTGGSFSELTYASAGDTVVWRIQVTNIGDQRVLNLFVTDTVPSNFTITETNPITTSQVGDEVSWVITTPTPALDVNETKTFLITGTVEGVACSLVATNTAQANFGCSTTDICLGAPVSDTASLQTQPHFLVQSIVGDLSTCGGVITITLNNDGPPGQNVVLTDTLPSGFVYESTVYSTTAPVTLPVSGSSVPTWTWTTPVSLPTGTSILAFRVRNDQTSGSCTDPGTPVSNQVDVEYNDTCTTTGPYTATGSTNIAVDSPALTVDKSPLKQDSDVGRVVTWTLRVTNTGTAEATNVVVTDVVASSYSNVTATIGSYSGGSNSPIVVGNTITWTPAITLTVGDVWTATVSATVGATGLNTNTVEAVGTCLAGCIYTTTSDIAYVTLLATFDKSPQIQTDTIGSTVVFTFTARTADTDALYENLILTDTLPTGLGYITSTLTYVEDIDGSTGGPFTVTTTPTISPAYKQSGDVVWQLGNISGTANITGVITAVIQNIAANQHGVSLTNVATMTYLFDGQDYVFTDTTEVDIVEPTLVIEKSANPTSATPGDTVFFEMQLYHATTSTVPAYNVLITDVVPTGLQYISNSWDQTAGPSADTLDDSNSPTLTASWSVIPMTTTQANPIRLRYNAVISTEASLGSIFTNTITTTWTSLLDDPYGERRDGSGGVDDYRTSDDATVSLSEVTMDKTGPLTVTAGEQITYTIAVQNLGPGTATDAVVTDTLPFQVDAITATYSVPSGSSGVCTLTPDASGDIVVCNLGSIPSGVTASITATGTVDADTPEGADLTNQAELTVTSPDGETINNTASADTEVLTEADVGVTKTGPITVTAGEQVTYTIVLSNSGPSTARDVDVKDLLPEGVTFVSGTSTQGTCTSGICQLGDVGVGATNAVTIVVTATVGSDVTGPITNTAQVFADTSDPNSSNDSDTASSTVNTNAALQLAKTDLTDPVYAGDTYFYEIVITNTGPSDALNVVITDQLPVYVTFEGASPGCVHDGSDPNGVVTCTVGTLAAGAQRDFLINTRVLSDTANDTTATNYVTATTSTTSTVFSDSEETTYLQKSGNPTDLALTKSVAPTTAVAGSGRLTYTLVITNNGPATASAVQVVDAFPREFDFVSATASDGSTCNSGVTCDLDEMANGEVVTITLVLDVPSDVVAGTYTNTATVGSASPDSNPDNNTASEPVNVTEQGVLQIRKVANPDPATPGEDLTYTILVTNTGPSDADNVTVTDTLPSDFTLALVTSSQGGCASLPCNLGTIVAGGHADITVRGTVTSSAGGSLENTAIVTSTTPGTGASDTVTTTLTAGADLALVKTATPTVNAGQTITYTLTAYNLGPSDAQTVRITDTLPVSVTFASASSGCADAGGGIVTCTLASLADGDSVSYTIVVTVANDVEPGTSLENTATVGSDTADSNASNNADDADTSIIGLAALALSKTGPITVTAGQQVTYTIVVTNGGPSVAQSVDVKDVLPEGVTYEAGSATQGVCVAGICQLGDVGVRETITIVITGTVGADVADGTVLTNTATMFSDTPEEDTTDNSDTHATTVETSADVSVSKVDLEDPVGPTEGLMYQITVRNDGPSDAQDVVVTDTLDADVTFAGASDGCVHDGSPSNGSVVCTVGTLAAEASASYLIAVTAGDVPSGTILTNQVTVTTSTTDTNSTNDTDSVTTTVEQLFGPTADLAISKTGTPGSVNAGENITYTLTITNAGPQAATNVEVLELLPADTTVITLTADNPDFAGEYCSLGGSCYLGTVYTDTTAVITVVLQVNADFSGSQLVNSAHVSADQRDPNTGNNIASETTTVTTSADLQIAKADFTDPVIAGEVLMYQIRITNTGPSDAAGVIITDSVPVSTSFVGASDFCAESNGVITCTLDTVAAGDTRSAFVQVRVSEAITNGAILTNTAWVSSTTTDPNPTNNSDTETTTAEQSALNPTDLEISKVDSTDPITAGLTLTYTLVITNNGPAPASNVRVLDALPDGVTFVSATASQGLCNSGVTCDLGDLAVNATATVTIVVTVDSDQTSGLSNLARVSASNPDSNETDNEATEDTTVSTEADLGIAKTGPDTATPGEGISYQIVVSNTGPSDAQSVRITDTLPSALQSATASASEGTCVVVSNDLTCTISSLAAGASATVDVNGTVGADVTGTITNTAWVTSTTYDPELGNNVDTEATPIRVRADLALSKEDAPDPVVAGTSLSYSLTIENRGPSDAQNVQLTDMLPVSVTFASASTECAETAPGSGVVTCTLASLAVGNSATFTITVEVDSALPTAYSLVNEAFVTSDATDPNPDNNVAVEDTEVLAQADLAITKTGQPEPVLAGELITYTLLVTNYGPSDAVQVQVVDSLPVELTLVSARSSLGYCGGATCILGDMAVNATATITLVAQVKTDVVSGTQLLNVALVSSPTSDPGPNINFDVARNTVQTDADVYVQKTHSGKAVAGNELTYQVTVGNNGPSLATGVVVTDTLPLSVTYVSDSDSCVRVAADPDVLRCDIGNLQPGSSESFQITVLVDQALTAGVVTNTVEVTSTTPDSSPGNNDQDDPTTVLTQADLRLTKTDAPDPVVAGRQITYTLRVVNDGPSRATNVVVTDTLPSGVTYITDTDTCALVATAPDVLACSLGYLDADATISFQVVASVSPIVPAASTLFNEATVDSDTPDPDSTDNDASAPTSVSALADVGVAKSGPDGKVVAGTMVTYTVVVSNSGPSAAQDVDVKDFLPDGVSLVSAQTHTGAPCLGTLCQLGTVAPDEVTSITIRALVGSDVVSGTVLENMVVVFSDTPDPGDDNDMDTVTNTVTTLAGLQIEKKDLSDPVSPESILLYSIIVTNTGPSDAQNVVVSDTLPAQVTYQDSTDSCVESPVGTLNCALNTVPGGSTQSFLVSVRVDATVVTGTVLTNRVSITSTTPLTDSVLTDEEETLVQQASGPPADLEITKEATSATVVAGEQITYTLVITNNGSGTPTDVEVSDSLPAGLTLVSATPSQGECDSGVTCLLGAMLFDGTPSTATITIVATVDPGIAADTTLTNTAFVQSSLLDSNEDNNSDHAVVGVNAVADLEVGKADGSDPVVAGELLAYTIVITNHGPSDAVNVVVTDTLPATVTVDTSDPCFTDVGGNTLVCTLSRVAAGETTSLDIVVSVPPTASGPLLNSVVIDSPTSDPDSANDSDDETTTVTSRADLSMAKAASSETAIAGDLITYTLTVQNAGPSVAQSVQVTDDLPSEVTFVSATPGYAGPNPLVWTVASLNPGENRVFTVAVRVNSDVAAGTLIRNAASVGSSTPDPVSTNNQDEATTQVFGSADLEVTKETISDTVVAGEGITFTIRAHNDGPSAATDVDVKELLPSGLTLDQLLTTQGVCAGTICQLGDVPVSTTVVITAIATADPSLEAGTQLTNTAAIFSDTPDPDEDDNTSEVTVTLETLADLAINKSAAEGVVPSGTDVTYTIVVTNNGPSDARGVVVTDTLPVSVTYSSDTDSCSEVAPGELECNLNTIPAGESVSFDIVVTVDPDITGTIWNTATVHSDEPDPTPGNNEEGEDITVVSGAYIEAQKQDSLFDDADGNGVPSPGDTLQYEITIVNHGTGAATDVNFIDTPDPNTSLVVGSVWTNQGTVTSGNGPGDVSVSVDVGHIPGYGGSVTIRFRVTITDPLPLGVTYVSNQGTVVSTELPDEPTDDPDTVTDDDPTVTPVPHPGVALTKILASDDPAYVAELVTFTIRITNTGNTTLVTVPLTDTYDTAYFDFVSAVPTPDMVMAATGQLVWHDLTGPPPHGFGVVFPPGTVVQVTVVMRAIHYTPQGVQAENTAIVDNVEDELGQPLPDVGDEDTVGVTVLPNIEMTKHPEVDGPIAVGDEITFTVQITNVGTTAIVRLPMTDTFDPAYLSFVRADLTPDRYVPGTIEWNDLTGTPPHGFGTPLSPGSSFRVTVVFTAAAATGATTNTVMVENGLDANGNPVNGLATATVAIEEQPTTAVIKFFTATVSADEVTLLWETITEIDNLGFNIWRSAQSESGYQRANGTLIPSQALGTSGAQYDFVDSGVPTGDWYYKLEIIAETGETSGWHGPVSAQVGETDEQRLYLPLLWKSGVGD